MSEGTVLIVEPDRSLAVTMSRALREHHYAVDVTEDGQRAFDSLERVHPDVIISALQLPGLSGMSLLAMVKDRCPSLRFILLLAIKEMSLLAEAMRKGAHKVLPRPPAKDELLDAVRSARREASPLSALATEIIGDSPAMVEVRNRVALAAKIGRNVLIMGETGTGKELVAGAVHRLSSRREKPLVRVNCANMSPDLWEGQFFGHRRGAFTGATEDRTGIFEEAHGSHIFLDELESLGMDRQARFLRVIEDGEVRPLGSHELRKVSVGFISATNQDPRILLAQGALRLDFYYRLAAFTIVVPPLRKHLEDIPLLAAYFLSETGTSLSREALDRFLHEEWPGNIRELRDRLLVASGVALATNETTITPVHIDIARPQTFPFFEDNPREGGFYVHGTLADIDRQVIMETLRQVGGNQSEAARRLGISRATLWRMLAAIDQAPAV